MKPLTLLIARALALLWAGFWLFFFIVESLAWDTPALPMLTWVGVGLVFVLMAMLPWRWEVTGGLVLAVAGLLIGVSYAIWAPSGLSLSTRVTGTIVFGAPPLVAGILFLVHHQARHDAQGRSLTVAAR